MNNNATRLDTWQQCPRRELLLREWTPLKWRQKALFTAVFRRAVFAVSNGADPRQTADDAKAMFMTVAANPGIEHAPTQKPYLISKEWCAILDTSVRNLGRLTLLKLHDAPHMELARNGLKPMEWEPSSWMDDSGQLHRWIVTDDWNYDDLCRELHSWHTIADVVIYQVPMMLHVLLIGQQRNERRHSSWARGFRHPSIPTLRMRFRKQDGTALDGWKPVFLSDNKADPDDWLNQMAQEGECERLLKHVTVEVPSPDACEYTRRQILDELTTINGHSRPWYQTPMSRGACDFPFACPFQPVCYTEKLVDIERLGFYKQNHAREVVPA